MIHRETEQNLRTEGVRRSGVAEALIAIGAFFAFVVTAQTVGTVPPHFFSVVADDVEGAGHQQELEEYRLVNALKIERAVGHAGGDMDDSGRGDDEFFLLLTHAELNFSVKVKDIGEAPAEERDVFVNLVGMRLGVMENGLCNKRPVCIDFGAGDLAFASEVRLRRDLPFQIVRLHRYLTDKVCVFMLAHKRTPLSIRYF